MSNRPSSSNIDVVINISDVLNFIPEFSGERGEVEFMYFREACRNALAVLGPRNESLLLVFLKTKLTEDAYMRFALRLPSYDKLSQFLCDAKHTYAPKCDDPTFWQVRMFEMRQKTDMSAKYAAKFQELLSCATIAARHEEMMQTFLAIQESKEQQKQAAAEQARKARQEQAAKSTMPKRRLNLDEVMEIISASAPYDDENPVIETPVSPVPPRGRAEKTLSIKGADYPQLEYPKMPPARPYKNKDEEVRVAYRKDEEDLKWELKPKTVAGKTS